MSEIPKVEVDDKKKSHTTTLQETPKETNNKSLQRFIMDIFVYQEHVSEPYNHSFIFFYYYFLDQ